jgi:hypothetical protein
MMPKQKATITNKIGKLKRKRLRHFKLTSAPADHPIYSHGLVIGGVRFNDSKQDTKDN